MQRGVERGQSQFRKVRTFRPGRQDGDVYMATVPNGVEVFRQDLNW
jgi:hypothetical protein